MLLPLLVSASPMSFITRHGPKVRLKPGHWSLEVDRGDVKVALVNTKTGQKVVAKSIDITETTEVAAQITEPGKESTVTIFIRRLGEVKSK